MLFPVTNVVRQYHQVQSSIGGRHDYPKNDSKVGSGSLVIS